MNTCFPFLNQKNLSIHKRKAMQKFLLIFLVSFTIPFFAQEVKNDTLITDEITVVKPYTPTISDAFKIKSTPSIDSTNQFEKEKVKYQIFSIPVASTFTPSKGKAKGVTRAAKEQLYDNYVSAGFGNYTTPLIEAFLHGGDNRFNDYGAFINFQSSAGGIKNVVLNDSYSNAQIDLFYKQFDRDFNWKIDAGYKRNQVNYYGLPDAIIFDDAVINAMDEKQVYTNIYVGGSINFEESIFEKGTIELSNFSDRYKSNEIRFLTKSTFEFPISTELINTEVIIDYISGDFEQSYFSSEALKYGFLNLGLVPNFEILKDDLSVNLGVKLYYTFNLENSVNEFKAYPNITASFNIVDEVFILFTGVTGDLVQNTYKDFTNENPFISPTLNIEQSDQQYNAFIGAKGILASNVGYNFNVSYKSQKNQALFIQNKTKTDGTIIVENSYEAGNSFNVVYDDLKTINMHGEINVEISKEFNFDAGIGYSNYVTTNELEAWNLPDLIGFINAEYKAKNWFVGTKIYFNGSTKDFVIPSGEIEENGSIVKNKSYVDLNFDGGYIISNQLSVFGKINNAIGESYHRFVNYPVQSTQFLAGITYKFDL